MFRRGILLLSGPSEMGIHPLSRVAIFPIHLDPPTVQHREIFRLLLGAQDESHYVERYREGNSGSGSSNNNSPGINDFDSLYTNGDARSSSSSNVGFGSGSGGGGGGGGSMEDPFSDLKFPHSLSSPSSVFSSVSSRISVPASAASLSSSEASGNAAAGSNNHNHSHSGGGRHHPAAPSTSSSSSSRVTAAASAASSSSSSKKKGTGTAAAAAAAAAAVSKKGQVVRGQPLRSHTSPGFEYMEGFAQSLLYDSQMAPFDDLILIPNSRYPVSLRQSIHLAALAVLAARGLPNVHVDFTALEHPDESMPVVAELTRQYPRCVLVHWLHDAMEMQNWRHIGSLKRDVPMLLLQTESVPPAALAPGSRANKALQRQCASDAAREQRRRRQWYHQLEEEQEKWVREHEVGKGAEGGSGLDSPTAVSPSPSSHNNNNNSSGVENAHGSNLQLQQQQPPAAAAAVAEALQPLLDHVPTCLRTRQYQWEDDESLTPAEAQYYRRTHDALRRVAARRRDRHPLMRAVDPLPQPPQPHPPSPSSSPLLGAPTPSATAAVPSSSSLFTAPADSGKGVPAPPYGSAAAAEVEDTASGAAGPPGSRLLSRPTISEMRGLLKGSSVGGGATAATAPSFGHSASGKSSTNNNSSSGPAEGAAEGAAAGNGQRLLSDADADLANDPETALMMMATQEDEQGFGGSRVIAPAPEYVRGPWWLTAGGRGDDAVELNRAYSVSANSSWLGSREEQAASRRRLRREEEVAQAEAQAEEEEAARGVSLMSDNDISCYDNNNNNNNTEGEPGEHNGNSSGGNSSSANGDGNNLNSNQQQQQHHHHPGSSASSKSHRSGRRRQRSSSSSSSSSPASSTFAPSSTTHSNAMVARRNVRQLIEELYAPHIARWRSEAFDAYNRTAAALRRRRRAAALLRQQQKQQQQAQQEGGKGAASATSRPAAVDGVGSGAGGADHTATTTTTAVDTATAAADASAGESAMSEAAERRAAERLRGQLEALPLVEVHPVRRCTGADIRQALWEHQVHPGCLLTDCVMRYIESHGLYRDARKYASANAGASLMHLLGGGGSGGRAMDETKGFDGTWQRVPRRVAPQKETAFLSFPGVIPRLELHYDQHNLLAREQFEKLKVFQAAPGEEPDLIVPIGGDGYMMHCIREHWRRFIPFYGVNAGHVGYLLNDCSTLDELFSSPLKLHMTTMLYCQAERDTETGERMVLSELAFNDAWIERATGQTALIRILVNGEERIRRLRGDGVLVSTAAGSTAYSQALGASPVPVGAPLIQVVGSNVVSPAQWRPAHLDQEDEVELQVIDTVKRPCECYVDSVNVGHVSRMLVRSSRVAGVCLAFSTSCDLQHKLYQMQFPASL